MNEMLAYMAHLEEYETKAITALKILEPLSHVADQIEVKKQQTLSLDQERQSLKDNSQIDTIRSNNTDLAK